MMDTGLTIDTLLDRATEVYPDREIVSKLPDGSKHRYTYADAGKRIAQLAHGLDELGLDRGDRVSVVAVNHYRHFELYFAPGCSGRSIHMCNMRLPDDHFQFIINDAEDKVVFVDPHLIDKVEANADQFETVEQYVVLDDEVPETDLEPVMSYEELLEGQPETYEWPDLDENRECGMCYTSGTTGLPKGVAYSHRGVYLHSMMVGHVDAHAISNEDVVMPVVPMFHANAWGFPYASTFVGAKQVFPSTNTDPGPVAELIAEEDITISAAVPTIWLEMADYLEEHPGTDISDIDRLLVGGSAPPESLIRRYDEEYDAPILQGWGMTELTPVGTISSLRKELKSADPEVQYAHQAKAGMPVPGIKLRIRDEDGDEVPRDDETMGEIEVRGPWVLDGYHNRPEANEESFTDDGWFKTGDIATWNESGYIDIADRKKDVIKSGGEWISSVQLENELMGHEAVAEATVIAIPHEKWQERPLAHVVTYDDEEVSAEELEEHLLERFPKWWLPEAFEFIEEIPRTSTGKFDKMKLREQFESDETDA
ncbi:MAG: long-chain fatty acid--CoA ligase [Natronomonas sp.]